MVHTQIKRVVFGTFFSLNLLVGALQASYLPNTDSVRQIVPYAAAAMVVKLVEGRYSQGKFSLPGGFYDQLVSVGVGEERAKVTFQNKHGKHVEKEICVDNIVKRQIGFQVGNIPVNLLTIPQDCAQWKQVLNTDVLVPGANLKNVFSIYAAWQAWGVIQPKLPAVPGFSKK